MEIRVIRKNMSDDELMHHKYVKREKVNGKWRYYYDDKNSAGGNNTRYTLDEMAAKVTRGDFKNGAERKELLGDSYDAIQKRVNRNYQNIDYDKKDGEYKNAQKSSDSLREYAKNTTKRGHNKVMKILNNIGDGTIDDKARDSANKAKKYMSKLFNR